MAYIKRVEFLCIERDEGGIWRWSATVDGWKESGVLCCGEDAGDAELHDALPQWIKAAGAAARVERWTPRLGPWLKLGAWAAG